MSDGAALLTGVLEQPEDDTVRLVYADWLQENGQEERAEFIRWQIAKRRRPRDIPRQCLEDLFNALYSVRRLVSAPTAPGVTTRSRPLYAAAEWRGGAARFRRGFLDELSVGAGAWLSAADQLTAAHPISQVRLTRVTTDDLDELSARVRERFGPEWFDAPREGAEAFRALWPRITFVAPA